MIKNLSKPVFATPFYRHLSTSSNPTPILWVNGGTSDIASAIIERAVNQKFRVFSAARKIPNNKNRRVEYVELANNATFDIEKMQHLFDDHLLVHPNQDLTVVNAVGGAHPTRDTDLRKLNIDSVYTVATALDNHLENKEYKARSNFVQLSSAAANWLSDEYGLTKREADELLLKNTSFQNIQNLYVFRIGYAVQSLDRLTRNLTSHAMSPEQLARHSLVIPIIYHNGQEPNFHPVNMTDIEEAALNVRRFLTSNKNRIIINAVGQEEFTCTEFLRAYTEMLGVPFIPMPVSSDEFDVFAKYFPYGHIAGYAAEYAKLEKETQLDTDNFRKLLGRELTPLSHVAKNIELSEVFIPNPFMKYIPRVVKTILTSREAQKNALPTLLSTSYRAMKTYLRAKLGLKKNR